MNETEYATLQERWTALLSASITAHPNAGKWSQWFDYSYGPSAVGDETVPIFGMINSASGRGISVHVYTEENESNQLVGFVKESLAPECVIYLSVISNLAPPEVERVRALLDYWFDAPRSLVEATAFLDKWLGTDPDEIRRRMEVQVAQIKHEKRSRK